MHKNTNVLKDVVPLEKLIVVEEALQQTFGSTENVESMSILSGGLSGGLSYKFAILNKSYILRIVIHRNTFQDPTRYFSCMKIASDAGTAPKLFYSNAETGISIVEYIEKKGEIYSLPQDIQVEKLAKIIQDIHNLPQFPPLIDFLTGVEILMKNNDLALLPEHLRREHEKYFSIIQAVYPRNSNIVSSHNDLNPGNLLYDGEKIWVIDWESSFSADEYVDLAVILVFFPSVQQNEHTFLTTYFKKVDSYKKARFFLMRSIVYTYYAVIFLQIANITEKDAIIKNEAIPHYSELFNSKKYPLSSPQGQYLMCCALLHQSIEEMKSDTFKEAINEITKTNDTKN